MLPEKLQSKIEFEKAEIDRLVFDFEPLLLKIMQSEPDMIELAASASLLHSFYNGIEKIFEFIAKELDEMLPEGSGTHKKLLLQMATANSNREAVISDEMQTVLEQYLSCRHFFRHAYSFQLNFNKIKPLLDQMSDTWNELKKQLN